MSPVWRIELLGTLKAIRGSEGTTRFRTRRVASLLAYLAYFRHRIHPRDELAEMLWPDEDMLVSRRNLRQALSSLRHILEPAPLPTGSVILSIHDGVQLNPETLTTDVAEFESLLEAARRVDEKARSIELTRLATDLYRGELLPGFGDEWIWTARARLEDLHLSALGRLGEAASAEPTQNPFGVAHPAPEIGRSARKLVLPVYVNSFFGRERELSTLSKLLEDQSVRLVTLIGPAGVGKTRLSIACAGAIANRQIWNIWFIPLADCVQASRIFEAILAVIAPNQAASSSELFRICELTKETPTLLILDNLEQMADDAGAYVAELLDRAPQIRCLSSSRQPLLIQHEHCVELEPLPLPADELATPAELALVPSIQLFMDRCRRLRPDLSLNLRNSAAVVSLCSRLDGLPLALEIAAGLANSFSPAQMLQHLPPHMTELQNRRRDVPARHKSLRAAIDWSCNSLSTELLSLFLDLCVFRGGFTLAAATGVCSYDDAAMPGRRLDELLALQERSLVKGQAAEDGGEVRFSVLIAFREYAEEHLSSERLAALRERHAQYFSDRAPPERPYVSTEEQTLQHRSIEADYENFVAAIEFSLSQDNLERCVRILEILAVRWLARGPKATERRLIVQISRHPQTRLLSAHRRVQLQRMLGTTYIRSGEYGAAYHSCLAAVDIALKEGDQALLATCYSGLSVCAGYLGRLQECLELNEKVLTLVGADNLALAERSYLGIGSVLWNFGRIEAALESFQNARAVREILRGGEPDALIVINLARVALALGQYEESLKLANEGIRISRRLRDDFTLAVVLTVVSRYQAQTDHLEAAIATNREALEKFRQGDFLFWILHALRYQAILYVAQKRLTEAAMLFAATADQPTPDGSQSLDLKEELEALDLLRRHLSPKKFEAAWAKGLAMDRAEALALAAGGVAEI